MKNLRIYLKSTYNQYNKVNASIFFASNKQMFSMNQNLLTKNNLRRKDKSQGWKFEGTVDILQLKSLSIEENIFFDDFKKNQSKLHIDTQISLVFGVWNDRQPHT